MLKVLPAPSTGKRVQSYNKLILSSLQHVVTKNVKKQEKLQFD